MLNNKQVLLDYGWTELCTWGKPILYRNYDKSQAEVLNQLNNSLSETWLVID